MDNPREDVLVQPEFAILEFGDGYIAMTQGGTQKVDNEGRKIIEFLIKPSNLLRKRFDIREEQLNNNGAMLYSVLREDLIPINMFDDANRKWLYVKNFDREDTEITRLSWDLRRRLQDSERRVMVLEGELIWLSEQLQLAKTNPAEFAAQGFELVDKLGTKIASLIRGKKGDDDDD